MGDDGGGGEAPHGAKTGRAGDGEAAGPGGTGGAADSSRTAAAGRGTAGGGGAAGGGASAVGEPGGEEAEAGRGGGAGGGAGAGETGGLHGEDLRRVESQLKRGPGTLGYKKWTSARVKELIERQCRVKYDASQAWRILRRMGWSFHPSGPKPGPPGTPGFHPSGPKPGPPGTPGWRRGGGGWRKTQSSQNRA